MESSTINIRNDLCSARAFRALWFAEKTGLALVTPDDGVIRDCNNLFAANMGRRSRHEVIGKTFMELTHPDDLDDDLAMVRKCIEGKMDSYSMYKSYINRETDNSGTQSYTENLLCVVTVRDELGHVDYFVSETTRLVAPDSLMWRLMKTLSSARALAILGTIGAGLIALSDSVKHLASVLKNALGG